MAAPVRRITALALGAALLGGLPACSAAEKPDSALKSFLTAWEQGKLDGMSLLTLDGQTLTGADAQKLLTTTEGDLAVKPPKLTVKKAPVAKKDDASATVTVAWPISDTATWTYDTTVNLRKKNDKWVPAFGVKTINDQLSTGEKLVVKNKASKRGQMLDGAGQPLVTNRAVVAIGVTPGQVTNLEQLVKNLDAAFKQVGAVVDVSQLASQVKAAKPDAFVSVATIRKEQFDQVAGKIKGNPGVVTRDSFQSLAPSATFARGLLGSSGEVTKEIIDKNPGKYKIGDVVGLGGLQAKYDDVLRGASGLTVVISKPQGVPDVVLFTSEAKDGGQIKLSLDVKTQQAAETALTNTPLRSALVAIKISDNRILAVANGPASGQNNTALSGSVPPGSTFKTITALGVLENGSVNANTTVPCPKTLTVDGRTFKNSGGEELGNAPLHVDFAQSCNTAFASLAPKLGGGDALAKTAASVGIGIPWDLGADINTGKVSANGSPSEQAAAAFGQGTTTVSPVVMAGAAAAIARGQWKQPQLVTDPAPAKPAADGPQIQPASLDALRGMMREVVTSGTASQLKNLSGDLRGKTGTAEFDDNPAHTHSWFMGYRGDIAFCVFVENGGASTAAAVPIAGKFFQALG
jgi:cell division protein FtsI/penicillin-binding protein 2